MDAGKAKAAKVNVDKYLDTLDRAGFGKDVQKLKKTFNEYGIKGDATFYQGPKIGDGEILLTYKMGNISGILRLTQTGKLYDVVTENTRASLSDESASLFIAGLFGKRALSRELDRNTDLLFQGIVQAHACYDSTNITRCDHMGIDFALAKIKLQKFADEYNWYATRIYSRETLSSRTSVYDGQIIQFPANISEIRKNISLYNAKISIAQEVYMKEKTGLLERKIEKLYEEIKEKEPWYKTMFMDAAKKVMGYWEKAQGTTIRSKFCAAMNAYEAMFDIADDLRDYKLDRECIGWRKHWEKNSCSQGEGDCGGMVCDETYYSKVKEDQLKTYYLDKSWSPTEACNLKAELTKKSKYKHWR